MIDVREYTEVVSLYSVLLSVKPIPTNLQKYVVTRKFTIRTLILRGTYAWIFWGLLSEADCEILISIL